MTEAQQNVCTFAPSYFVLQLCLPFDDPFQNDKSTMATIMTTIPPGETLDTIEVLCHQEDNGYQVYDYLGEAARTASSLGPLHPSPIDDSCRSSMVVWCNNLVDFCKYNREISASALSCLDRYLSTEDGFQTLFAPEQFQLAAMCALYTTAKIHERQALEPSSIAKLSRGAHSSLDVEDMEARMLKALQWRVNPPTATSFVNLFLDLIPTHMLDDASRNNCVKLVQYQLSLSLLNYQLSLEKASHLALAALLNAIDSQEDDGSLGVLVQSRIGAILASSGHFNESHLVNIRCGLCDEISRQSASEPMRAILTAKISAIAEHSPKTVTSKFQISSHSGSPRMVIDGVLA
jgi:hypothetical protein